MRSACGTEERRRNQCKAWACDLRGVLTGQLAERAYEQASWQSVLDHGWLAEECTTVEKLVCVHVLCVNAVRVPSVTQVPFRKQHSPSGSATVNALLSWEASTSDVASEFRMAVLCSSGPPRRALMGGDSCRLPPQRPVCWSGCTYPPFAPSTSHLCAGRSSPYEARRPRLLFSLLAQSTPKSQPPVPVPVPVPVHVAAAHIGAAQACVAGGARVLHLCCWRTMRGQTRSCSRCSCSSLAWP